MDGWPSTPGAKRERASERVSERGLRPTEDEVRSGQVRSKVKE